MSEITEKQRRAIDFISRHFRDRDYGPTDVEIMEHVGLPLAGKAMTASFIGSLVRTGRVYWQHIRQSVVDYRVIQ